MSSFFNHHHHPGNSNRRPKLFNLLTIDELNEDVCWSAVVKRLSTHPHEASWFVPGSAATFRQGGYYATIMADREEQEEEQQSNNHGVGSSSSLLSSTSSSSSPSSSPTPLVGWTALHTALYLSPPPEAVRALLTAFPPAASMETSRGDTALHFATFVEVSPGVVRILLGMNPRAVHARNRLGDTPLSVLCGWWVSKFPNSFYASIGGSSSSATTAYCKVMVGDVFVTGEMLDQWTKLELMLRVAAGLPFPGDGENEKKKDFESGQNMQHIVVVEKRRHNTTTQEEESARNIFRPLHIAAKMGCPPQVLRFAFWYNQSQAKERDGRENGRVPLAIAAASSEVVGESGRAIIQELLRLDPTSASSSDGNGRLPLHLALENGKTWESGVKLILDAAPQALQTRDVTTHLYPFMTAAAVGNDSCSIDTVYMLLRSDPELARGMADDPPWLRWERGWTGKLEAVREACRAEIKELQLKVDSLEKENYELKRKLSLVNHNTLAQECNKGELMSNTEKGSVFGEVKNCSFLKPDDASKTIQDQKQNVDTKIHEEEMSMVQKRPRLMTDSCD